MPGAVTIHRTVLREMHARSSSISLSMQNYLSLHQTLSNGVNTASLNYEPKLISHGKGIFFLETLY